MIEEILAWLTGIVMAIINTLGYWGVMIASALESACIPLPSEIIFPFSGYLVSSGHFTFWAVIFWGMIGQILGSLLAYWVGIVGGIPLLRRYGKYILIREKEIDHAHAWFERYGEAAVFFGRLLPVVRTFISLPAGIARMNIWKFLVYTALGCLPWLIALTYAGVLLGDHWVDIKKFFIEFKTFVIAGLLILLAWWVWSHLRKNEARNNRKAK
ncbi:MAG: DedA family protein [Candidatus Eremiobacteraeota bacterium]|nr:DedA family protein [Candidatus Eremiobacteraeota bacterium]